jgi:PAS domain-containing protein
MTEKHIALYPFNSTHVSWKFLFIPSQMLRAWLVALAAMSATAVYDTTKLICFPRMSVLQSHVITIFFVGCVGFCISFVVRRRDMEVHQEPLRLAAVVENSDDAINSVDLDGTVISWNPGTERTYGHSAAEALGRHISFCMPPENHAELDAVLQRITGGEVIERFDKQRLTN